MPYAPLADGAELDGAHMLANLYNQVISQVTSASRPGSPAEGQVIYETDTDSLYIYSGSGWVAWGGIGAWIAYTPTLVQSAAVTKTMTYAKYTKIGRLVVVNVRLAVTGTGAVNNPVEIGLPVASSGTGGYWNGTGAIYDATAGTIYPGIPDFATTTSIQLTDSTAPTTAGVHLGGGGTAFTAALASGDGVSFSMQYESAT